MGEKAKALPTTHVELRDVKWSGSAHYPEALRRVYHYKALIGGSWPGVIPHSDVLMGVLELAPGAIYPGHQHPAPEIYYVVSGTAEWSVGDEAFVAEAGTAIYHAPGMLHRMINTGDDVLRLVYGTGTVTWPGSGSSNRRRHTGAPRAAAPSRRRCRNGSSRSTVSLSSGSTRSLRRLRTRPA